MPNIENLISAVKQVAIDVHQELGPGLLESVYEELFFDELSLQGLRLEKQLLISLQYKDRTYQHAYRLDLLLEGRLVIELKSAEKMSPLFSRQVLTYLRCLKLRHGLVVNMGLERAIDGIDRVVNFRVPPEPGDS
jgi:iron complex transport system substrate-binding protein